MDGSLFTASIFKQVTIKMLLLFNFHAVQIPVNFFVIVVVEYFEAFIQFFFRCFSSVPVATVSYEALQRLTSSSLEAHRIAPEVKTLRHPVNQFYYYYYYYYYYC